MIELLTPDLTPLDNVEIPTFEAGQPSGVIPFVLRNTGPDAFDALLVLQAVDPTTDLPVTTGLPPLDELWARVRLTGQAGAATNQLPELTDWQPLGTHRPLRIQTLLAGGQRTAEIRFHPPATAPALTWRFTLAVIVAENAYPIGPCHRTGILTGLGDHGHSAILKGFAVTPTTPPSDQVHVAAGHFLHRGRLIGRVGTTLTLDQTDAASAPLAPGESYLALLTASPTGITLTKSLRAPVPVRPAAPPWEPVLAVLEVQAAATTEITATNLTDLRHFDRYQAEPGPGLHLRLHPGRLIAAGTLRHHATPTTLLLPPSTTTALWQLSTGAWDLQPAIAPPPETTAYGPLWLITTGTDQVLDLQDRRTYATETTVIHLKGPLPATPGPIAETLIVQEGLTIEDVIYRLAPTEGATAGQTKLDLRLDGATLYPSHPQEDHRPTWPHDTTTLTQQGHIHEQTALHSGQVLQLVSLAHPTGATPAWAEAYLLCRRP